MCEGWALPLSQRYLAEDEYNFFFICQRQTSQEQYAILMDLLVVLEGKK